MTLGEMLNPWGQIRAYKKAAEIDRHQCQMAASEVYRLLAEIDDRARETASLEHDVATLRAKLARPKGRKVKAAKLLEKDMITRASLNSLERAYTARVKKPFDISFEIDGSDRHD